MLLSIKLKMRIFNKQISIKRRSILDLAIVRAGVFIWSL
jgi:hypothetical protein